MDRVVLCDWLLSIKRAPFLTVASVLWFIYVVQFLAAFGLDYSVQIITDKKLLIAKHFLYIKHISYPTEFVINLGSDLRYTLFILSSMASAFVVDGDDNNALFMHF